MNLSKYYLDGVKYVIKYYCNELGIIVFCYYLNEQWMTIKQIENIVQLHLYRYETTQPNQTEKIKEKPNKILDKNIQREKYAYGQIRFGGKIPQPKEKIWLVGCFCTGHAR